MEQPDFGIEARPITDADHRRGLPGWSEILLEIVEEGNESTKVPLTRAAGELIIEALHEALHPNYGKPLIQKAVDELEVTVDRLLGEGKSELEGLDDDVAEVAREFQRYGETRGRAHAYAHVVAMFRNPYAPDLPGVKREFLERAKRAG